MMALAYQGRVSVMVDGNVLMVATKRAAIKELHAMRNQWVNLFTSIELNVWRGINWFQFILISFNVKAVNAYHSMLSVMPSLIVSMVVTKMKRYANIVSGLIHISTELQQTSRFLS